MKHPIAAASAFALALALGGSAALAEQSQQMQHQQGQTTQGSGMGQQSGQQGAMTEKRADQIAGMEVVNREGKKIGKVEKVLRDKQNNKAYTLVSVGGFFDIGDKDIVLPLDSLRVKDNKLVVPRGLGTKAALSSLPPWDESKYHKIADSEQVGIEQAEFAAFESKGSSGNSGNSGSSGGM
ncbi:MAG: PRC-barrel domain-containing protein [Thiohalocapsa sp.]|uniref:PRC-barrel domain-containing protein n=1 Tax=Thiohalocapsa sp. TaxID=2497641 RepID=UPI0025F4DF84|nr:PRC-barrel domain-containing protein [Thiohalocapsa sp.]MCG6941159.1 PRC-barrel domain-containing protein [Thiohalocapsa sp.]